jgi:uncharacterized RDD family membrane protein YckC
LQEFWALQPLSLALQPPLPLHEFWPLQACLSLVCLVAFFVLLSVVLFVELSCANILALVPATIPARAALAIANFTDFVIKLLLIVLCLSRL